MNCLPVLTVKRYSPYAETHDRRTLFVIMSRLRHKYELGGSSLRQLWDWLVLVSTSQNHFRRRGTMVFSAASLVDPGRAIALHFRHPISGGNHVSGRVGDLCTQRYDRSRGPLTNRFLHRSR